MVPRFVLSTGILALLVAVSCSRTPSELAPQSVVSPPPSQSVVPAAVESGTAAPSASSAPSAAFSSSVAEVAPPQGTSVKCGSGSCNPSTQVCCGRGDDFGCAPRKPLVEGDYKYMLLVQSCTEHVKSEFSLNFLSLCDGSGDCPQGQVCCLQMVSGDSLIHACIPADPGGKSVCEYGERCDGQSCVTGNTTCVEGKCRLTQAKVNCAGAVCKGAKPVCCQHDPGTAPRCEATCKAKGDVQAFEFECSSPASCASGEQCQAGLLGSGCVTAIDVANAVLLCESDRDCPADLCGFMGQKTPPKCTTGAREGFKSCSCD